MKARQWAVTLGLLALVVLAAAELILTRASREPAAQTRSHRTPLVDEKPLQTARTLAALAISREDRRFSQQALKLADHEVDLAFADGLRDAAEHPVAPTHETQELLARLSTTEAAVKTDQQQIEQLKKKFAAADASHQDALQDQIDLTQAQLELDQDEFDDAKEDMVRSGADPLSRIQRQFKRHEATQQELDSHPQTPTDNSDANDSSDNLISQFSAWYKLRGKVPQLQQARDEALHAAESLSSTHDTLDKQVKADEGTKQAVKQEAATQIASASSKHAANAPAAKETIASLHHLAVDQKDLADLDKRIQDHQQLAETYGNWIAAVATHQRAALHQMIRSGLLLALILLGVYLAGRLIDHFFQEMPHERTRFRTLRVIMRFAVQAVGLLLVLFVLFGTPNQTSTILGLAGAGLTVALKDFIVAFFGWFVLMGRNGISVGDWVEINGVSGEVVHISLLRTVLLESGSWSDAGQPTGRKATFMNSFAIEGHFFNFSTTGQWLWDELQLPVPAGENPYPLVEAVQKLETERTAASAHLAEEEWKRSTTGPTTNPGSAAPVINVRPTHDGVEISVRYITHAHERQELRAHLYQALVDLLHQKDLGQTAAKSPAAQGAS